ncbi:transglutaminase N-terminal domain-containing protein [Ponticoccus litoralis]|uniref:transglutaminase N-terminal domain-containing protein n=1 Tax=Ponticoccus litoralis TaxID=422297 RepID=UPI003D2F3B97
MSQLYDITLAIHYRYQNPARSARTLLRMQPLNRPDQRLVSGLLTIDPAPATRRDWTDFFGNAICEVAHDAPTDRLTFRYSGRVERIGVPEGLDLSCPLAALGEEMAEIGDLGPGAPHHFIGASERVQPVPEITAFARAVTAPAMSALTAVRGDLAADARRVRLRPDRHGRAHRPRRGLPQPPGRLSGHQPCHHRGAARGRHPGRLRLGLSAHRAARGQAPAGRRRRHARRVRAWCGTELGWVQIDPTNDMRVGTDHVMVALGRDYADVAPVRGTLTSAGAHDTRHHVDVVPV